MLGSKRLVLGSIPSGGARKLEMEAFQAFFFAVKRPENGFTPTLLPHFIAPRNSPNVHTPDILMDGVSWEIKCPKGKSKRTIENNFRKAKEQAENIIFDLRRINISEDKCVLELKLRFAQKRDVKRLLIIKKNGESLRFSR